VREPAIPIHRPDLGAEELAAVAAVFQSRWLGMGEAAAQLERRLAELAGARHAIVCASASAALHLALHALGIGPGDEVLLPSLTFVANPQAVLAVGARPVFCEVDPQTGCLDPADAARRLSPRSRVLMPVHYAGFPCAMDDLLALAGRHGLAVVEDAAHALGTCYRGRSIGSLGTVTCFSFDPAKNLTCGEGGALTTNDDDLARALRRARNLGVERDSLARRGAARPWRYEAVSSGFRSHLSDIQAAIALAQLERLEELRARKRAIFRRYREGLAGASGIRPLVGDIDSAFPLLFVVRVTGGRRDALLRHLAADGIQAWVHYVPCHLQPAFAAFACPLPVTERLYGELLTLPSYPGLSEEEVERVLVSVRSFLGQA
jgi:dTDP-4-amino-4,6-dideoxygalactose transaminase